MSYELRCECGCDWNSHRTPGNECANCELCDRFYPVKSGGVSPSETKNPGSEEVVERTPNFKASPHSGEGEGK